MGTPLSAFASIASSEAGTPDRRYLSSTRGSERSGDSAIDRGAACSSKMVNDSGMTTPTALMYDGRGSRGGGGGDRGGG
eukprot:1235-Eustigmatos_ZCMA.PRE.1